MDKTPTTIDRRRFQRILFDAPVSLIFNEVSHKSDLLDISLKGALVKTAEDWQISTGSRVELTVALNDVDSMIQMQMQVTHIEDGQMGLICEAIDMQSLTHLRRLVELNVGDSSLLERELQALG